MSNYGLFNVKAFEEFEKSCREYDKKENREMGKNYWQMFADLKQQDYRDFEDITMRGGDPIEYGAKTDDEIFNIVVEKAKTDERDRIIGEIEKIIAPFKGTVSGKHHPYRVILDKLNLLKNKDK